MCTDFSSAVYVRNHFVNFTTQLCRAFVPAACSLYILARACTLREEISNDGLNYDFAARNCFEGFAGVQALEHRILPQSTRHTCRLGFSLPMQVTNSHYLLL